MDESESFSGEGYASGGPLRMNSFKSALLINQ